MKNLHDDEMMKSLKDRLSHYAEEPDDDTWEKIAAATSKPNGGWIRPAAWGALMVGYGVLMFYAGSYFGGDSAAPPTSPITESAASGESQPAIDSTLTRVEEKHPIANAPTRSTLSERIVLPQSNARVEKTSQVSADVTSPLASSETAPSSTPEIKNDTQVSDWLASQSTETATVVDTAIVKEQVAPSSAAKALEKKESGRSRRPFPTLYMMAGPSLAYQRITPSVQDEVMITKLNSTGILSAERLGWSAEGGMQWDVKDKFVLFAGLAYYHHNGYISYSYQDGSVGSVQQSDGLTYVITPRETTTTISYQMRSAGLSAAGLYHLQGIKLRHYIGAGLQFQAGKLTTSGADQNKSSMYLNYRVLYRMEFVMSKRYRLFAQPYYASALWSMENLTEAFDVHPYRVGVELGGCIYFR